MSALTEQLKRSDAEENSGPTMAPHERRTQTSALPNWTADDIRTAMRKYNRSPFQDLMAVWLEQGPTAEEIRQFARKSPDKWATAISQMAKTAGFSERRENLNMSFNVSELSDSQLEDTINSIAQYMGIEPLRMLEAVNAVMLEGSVVQPPIAAKPQSVSDATDAEIIPPDARLEEPIKPI
jgi:hypothetical protein